MKNMSEAKQQLEEVEGLLKTASGMEYTEHPFKSKQTGEERTLRYFRSISPERLSDEGETKEEYIMRRRITSDILKKYNRGRLVWTPYPFGKSTKGMSCNGKNREFIDAYIDALKKKEESKVKDDE